MNRLTVLEDPGTVITEWRLEAGRWLSGEHAARRSAGMVEGIEIGRTGIRDVQIRECEPFSRLGCGV
jgi:hypothetical protein